jgi:hypothetical protein
MSINSYFDNIFLSKNEEIQQTPVLTMKTAPTLSIVTTTETKLYCKIGYTNDDNLIDDIIKTSQLMVQNQIQKCLVKQSWEQKQKGGCSKITILKAPIIGTPTVTVYDDFDSTGEVLTTADIRIVDNVLYHVDNYFTKKRDGDGYKIEFDCGIYTSSNYTSSNDLERNTIKEVVLRISAFLYENRQIYCQNYNQENWSINYNYSDLPIEVKHILSPLRQPNLGLL